MTSGIELSAAGARAQSLRHDVIANNLANVNTVGFKRHLAIVGARGTSTAGTAGAVLPDLVATPAEAGRGTLMQTGRPYDLALDGDGYFVVSDGSRRFYTRAGHFDVDAQGFLVTADHRFRVLGVGGQPIALDPTLPVTVTEAGTVVQAGTPIAQLDIVTFRDPSVLVNQGGGLLAAPPGATPGRTRLADVQQGYLEHSAVEAVQELVTMLEAFRAYEANVRHIENQHSTLSRLIETAGRVA